MQQQDALEEKSFPQNWKTGQLHHPGWLRPSLQSAIQDKTIKSKTEKSNPEVRHIQLSIDNCKIINLLTDVNKNINSSIE